VIAASASDWADYALAVFLILTGLGLAFALFRLAGVFERAASFLRSSEREVMPVINKTGGTIDRVNRELDKLDPATDSAVDAVVAVDEAVRAVSFAIKRPIQKLVGISAGAKHGLATMRARRNVKAAVASGKEAAARREADFEDDLSRARSKQSA
jgi:hypothetical protein